MNDLMSLGLHRVWKAYTVKVANLKEGGQVLDIEQYPFIGRNPPKDTTTIPSPPQEPSR